MSPVEKIRAANSRLVQLATGCRDTDTKKQLAEISKAIATALTEAEAPPKNLAAMPKIFRN